MLTTAASMIDQFNMPNIRLMKEAGYRVRAVCNFEQGNTCDEQRIQELESTLCRMGGGRWHQWGCLGNICPVGQWIRAHRQLWELTGQYHIVYMCRQSDIELTKCVFQNILMHSKNEDVEWQ